MNTTSDRGTEVAGYLAQVRAALADLPEATRDQLIDDVPEHLAEVAAAGPEPLRDRLGPPAEFAAELRASAGFGAAAPVPPARGDALTAIGAAARAAGRNIGLLLGYPGIVAAGRAFAPGWWVLRGAIAVFAVTFVVVPDYRYSDILYGSVPERFMFWLMVLVGAVVSLRVGQAVAKAGAGVRGISVAFSLVVVAIVLWASPFRQLFPYLPF